jgi:hypothetical protein
MRQVVLHLLAWLVLLSTASAQQSRRYCEFQVNKAPIKIFLEEGEAAGTAFPAGSAKAYLKLLGLPENITVSSEAWICDRASVEKQERGAELSVQEEEELVRFMIVGTDSRLSESDLKAMRRSTIDSGKDTEAFDRNTKATLERMKQAGAEKPFYTKDKIVAARHAVAGMTVVSEGPRHCTLAVESAQVNTIISYVLAESRLVMVAGWFKPGDLPAATKRAATIVTLIEDQSRKWDGILTSTADSRYNGPDGLFSFKCSGKWQRASAQATSGFFPPGTKSVLLQHPDKTAAGNFPLVTLVLERREPQMTMKQYWEMSLTIMEDSIRSGIISGMSDPKPYPTSSGWPAVTGTFVRNNKLPINCRVVVLMVGPGEFLTATIMADETVKPEIIQGAWECIDSIDTPTSPKQKALR